MVEISYNNMLLLLILTVLALLMLLLKLWRGKRSRFRLEDDACGLWRYSKDTQFLRKASYDKQIIKDENRKQSDISEKASDKESPTKQLKENLPVAVINFSGDVRAKQRGSFAKMVDEIAINKHRLEEVVVIITSSGGMVAHYGHAFAEMERLRSFGLRVVVCIDVVAASGGYLMSLPAHEIIAAPFAMVGSLGVTAFIPNVRELLNNFHITPRTFNAGKFKRTVTYTDDANPEEVEHFQNQLEAIHRLLKAAVLKYRSQVKIDQVETGDHWTAQESIELELGLVDKISTSNDYLLEKNRTHDLIVFQQKRSFLDEGLSRFSGEMLNRIEERFWGRRGEIHF